MTQPLKIILFRRVVEYEKKQDLQSIRSSPNLEMGLSGHGLDQDLKLELGGVVESRRIWDGGNPQHPNFY